VRPSHGAMVQAHRYSLRAIHTDGDEVRGPRLPLLQRPMLQTKDHGTIGYINGIGGGRTTRRGLFYSRWSLCTRRKRSALVHGSIE